MKIARIPGPFGVEITDINLVDEMDDEAAVLLLYTFYEEHVVVVRDQAISPDAFERFARLFGNPFPHVLRHLMLPTHPMVMPLTNQLESGQPEELANAANYWHTDQSYDADPASATLLHALKVPQTGGETHLINLRLAYEALPPDVRRDIDDLMVVHARDEGAKTNNLPLASPEKHRRQCYAHHRLVRPHPATARKTLYGIAGTPVGIKGMAEAEARAVLDRLMAHARHPDFRYDHCYRPGDILVMDTAATLHAAAPLAVARSPEEVRLLHRISTRGQSPYWHSEGRTAAVH